MVQQDAPRQPGAISVLPLEQLARVLSWLPTGEHLACAPVCRVWREAAVAATTSLSARGIRQGKADQLSAWIAQYGKQLQELSAAGLFHNEEPPTLALATSRLPGLRSLDLVYLRLEERPSPDQQQQAPNLLAGLPQLERLRLDTCTLAWPGGLAGLSALSRLRSLELFDLGGDVCSGAELAAALASAWPQLRALTSLRLDCEAVTAAALAGLGYCTSLEELDLRRCQLSRISLSPSEQPGVFSDIAQLRRLTSLQLWGDGISIVPAAAARSTAAAGEVPALSCLQRLTLSCVDLDPRALAELPQLQAISLENVEPLGSSEEQAAQQLLAQLGRQTQLAELQLRDTSWRHALPAAAYAGLTASSQLTELVLHQEPDLQALDLPAGAASHLFGPGRSLPQLHVLHITGCGKDTFGPGDLQRLVAATPDLCSLTLDQCLLAGGSLQPLTGLTALTHLDVACRALDDESAGLLATLSQLRSLELWDPSQEPTWRSMLQLTRLTALTLLSLAGCTQLGEQQDLKLVSTAPEGQPPNVASRLLVECCMSDRGVLADALEQAAGERAALRAQLAERDAQLAELRAQLALAQAAHKSATAPGTL